MKKYFEEIYRENKFIQYRKGHKNKDGEEAPWVIISNKTGKVISSHTSKEKANSAFKAMMYYKTK